MTVLPSVIEAMGDTPLVELSRIRDALHLDGRILAKLDYLMPGFSKKDRAARAIIEGARATGDLAPGQTVVELTSGNMGTGLAIVCGVLDHPFVAVMSEGNSEERARMMRALGAEVILVPQAQGSRKGEVSGADLALVDAAAQQITAERDAYRADQFERAGNPLAHEMGTGPEIWAQSGGTVTAFCDFIGSGGTLAGVTAYLGPKGVRCYGIAPDKPGHPIQGGGYSMPDLTHLKSADLAGTVTVSGRDAAEAARLLARTEGIFAGYSAGANLAGAIQLLGGLEQGGKIAIVMCDSGLKYLSTHLWD
ncbi:Cysteine synthase [Roseovarius sp. THAF27]|uniref:PLP-dependent cysteine synthase family protein n=1 Tax=Roseovarius sp. THAF27 TaxID=2587850 RepID=UPI0012A8A57C|nr:cysteine synthase family protein [Roseovarius sp. THAF27]QFT82946.1 Cysteine synthase [Roseovarius sp. THAF27]